DFNIGLLIAPPASVATDAVGGDRSVGGGKEIAEAYAPGGDCAPRERARTRCAPGRIRLDNSMAVHRAKSAHRCWPRVGTANLCDTMVMMSPRPSRPPARWTLPFSAFMVGLAATPPTLEAIAKFKTRSGIVITASKLQSAHLTSIATD